jgi:hypothetical protein
VLCPCGIGETSPAIEPRLTIAPFPYRSISLPNSRQPQKTPFTFTSMSSLYSSSVTCSQLFHRPSPALLTRMSQRPKRRSVSPAASATYSELLTSSCMMSTSYPFAFRCAWPSLATSIVRDAITTYAPNSARASAIARPIPFPPPVTKATLSVRLYSYRYILL